MTVWIIALWVGLVIGHAIHRSRPVVVVDKSGVTDGKMHTILLDCARQIDLLINDLRPRNFMGVRQFGTIPTRSGNRFHEWTESLDAMTILHDHEQAMDVMAPVIQRVVNEIRRCGVNKGFSEQQLPLGLDFVGRVRTESGFQMRLVRGYDMQTNSFITAIGVEVM